MKLKIAAIVSTIAAILFSLGYAGQFCLRIYRSTTPPALSFESLSLELDRGRIAIWHQYDKGILMSVPYPIPKPIWTEWTYELRAPDLRQSLFGFDAHPIRINGIPQRPYLFAFPIWCALLPCLIAPLLWWRKRAAVPRRGFEVQPND